MDDGNATWRVGVDTGGTFTDLVATNGRELRTAKVPSTPPSYERGVLAAIADAGIELRDISMLAHGTTVATNAVITRTGMPTALLTTAGFRDVLELRRHNRGEMYDILWDPPAPLVPRRHRYEVRERIDYSGRVIQGLAEEDVAHAVDVASGAGITSFAVCFLHSYANPEHERRAVEIVRAAQPTAHVYRSSELLREPYEFERTSTVVMNAYLGPVVADNLEALSQDLVDGGFTGHLFVMHSGGGLLTAETAVKTPARLVTSGPAAGAMAAESVAAGSPAGGVAAATQAAKAVSQLNVISLDIGGTSADIAVIRDGTARLVNEYVVEFGSPIRFPAIDLTFIGAGGGSIASVDAGGLPSVGPASAGAVPGPAAYLRGGTGATLTDAHVVLGRLAPDTPLAGGVQLDVGAAHQAIARFAEQSRLDVDAAAAGIVAIANGNMARAIRLVTVERGLDPRSFALMPFGGAGGLHGAEIAELLGIDTVIVPVAPGVTSALGCLYVDIVHDAAQAVIQPLSTVDAKQLKSLANELEGTVFELLDLDGVPPEVREREVHFDVRYVGQVRGVTLRVDGLLDSDNFAAILQDQFLAEYETQFFYAPRDISIEIATVRVRGVGRQERPLLASPRPAGRARSNRDHAVRSIKTPDGVVEAVLYDREDVHEEASIEGPAIVYQHDSTTWLPPGWRCSLEPAGHLRLDRLGKGKE